jgi:hypothetical protein
MKNGTTYGDGPLRTVQEKLNSIRSGKSNDRLKSNERLYDH